MVMMRVDSFRPDKDGDHSAGIEAERAMTQDAEQ